MDNQALVMDNQAVLLPGSVVLVTGGGSGIGAATARLCAARGAAVGVVDRDGDHATAVARDIADDGGRSLGIECDVTDDAAVAAAVERTASLGRITGVVTSAGIFHGPDLQPIEQVSIDAFRHVIDVNLGGTFSAVKHALPMLADGGGSIVTIASTAALRGHGFGPAYTASKGGVDALTRLIAVQCGPRGVRANCVCPGGVDTPMTGGTFATDDAKARARRRIPLGRYATADDIAQVAAWLLSDGARYVTGQTFPVEGGALVS
jgi:NAD(P)-dependent dehydrogenase (short-subunit alcohol dehydrogenase family)